LKSRGPVRQPPLSTEHPSLHPACNFGKRYVFVVGYSAVIRTENKGKMQKPH
jgi:hypothetical protein